MSKERPISYSDSMVIARREGRKTQTRRTRGLKEINQQPDQWELVNIFINTNKHCASARFRHKTTAEERIVNCPYGMAGDRLWVREAHCPVFAQDPTYNNGDPIEIDYRVDYKHGDRLITPKWIGAMLMRRNYSRSMDEVVSIRGERLQQMEGQAPYPGESDALAEGVHRIHHGDGDYYFSAFRNEPHPKNWCDPTDAYRELWETINGPGSWDANPWVWVVEFKVVQP